VDPAGRPSRTDWRRLETHPGWSRLELRPHTGRSHQLRVHLQGRGHPLLGDTLYGGAAAADAADDDFYLHAVSLALPGHPLVHAPLPARWRTTLAAAGCPMPDSPSP
jgi:tRNA pseudouridine32 synthase/23S rRNA pseudouridine746 synthase